ncbi:MAG: amino acid adenylation domain-containing protein, partial [Lysobacteraceae bacterium]
GMVADETVSPAALPLMTSAQRDRVLFDFNATSAAYPKDALIHELFEQQAAAQPDAVAVVYEGRRLTYSELNARANQLAHYLLSQGVKPDDRVAICVERSLEMVVGLLGILKAGGAYVPLDPDYPVERLAYMLEDSAPVALLTQATLEERLPDHGVPTLRLDASDAQALLAVQPTHNPQLRANGLTARHLAYVIYTSGSTGMPKGVMVEHLSATNLILSHCSCCELAASDRVLQFASFAFDASVEEIFPALCVGASIVVRPAKLSLASESFSEYLDHYGVTVAELPTAFWHLWALTVDVIKCRSLRLVVVGGEKAERRAFQAWKSAGGMMKRRWLNTYGPTESTVYSAAIVFDEATPFPANEIPIGRPIANTQVYILDACGEPVPVGVAGEIHIGGDGVARGYWNREALTQERFVRDGFSADPQARMYKTGDLGRWLADGNIEYLGRNDFQVKLRGFRIELGEIEAKLAGCAGVREAVVLAREDVPGDKRLVAYLTAEAGAELSVAELRTRLSAQLPDYMVPSAFVVLDAFPLTPNGKLDRKALPAPDDLSLGLREYEAPQGEIEQALAEIWQQLLGIERAGRGDHFFELGGHSLLAVQMVSRVRERLGIELALRELFLHSTLSALAARMKAHVSTRTWSPLVPLKDRPGKPTLYMVPGAAMTAGSFWDLAQSLDGRMNVHVLEARGLEEGQKPCTRMEEIVEMNLSAMRESGLPEGPIVLGGHSFGGSVAFELARALEAAGHRVQLMLIDNVLALPKHLHRMADPEFDGILGTDKRLKKLFEAQCAIYKRYKPSGRFHGAVEVIYARDGGIKSLPEKERLHACRKYCEQQPVVSSVAGDHHSMLGAAHADELSEAIWQAWRRRHIDRSEGFTH